MADENGFAASPSNRCSCKDVWDHHHIIPWVAPFPHDALTTVEQMAWWCHMVSFHNFTFEGNGRGLDKGNPPSVLTSCNILRWKTSGIALNIMAYNVSTELFYLCYFNLFQIGSWIDGDSKGYHLQKGLWQRMGKCTGNISGMHFLLGPIFSETSADRYWTCCVCIS